MFGCFVHSSLSKALPSTPSMRRSVSTRSNLPPRTFVSASCPSLAVSTSYPSCSRIAAVVIRTLSSSSTTSTRCRCFGCALRAGASPLFLRLVIIFQYRRIDEQDDVKGRALTFDARHFDAPAMLSHDVLRHPETEPRPLLSFGEEGLEDARQVVFADAVPGVADLDGN